MLTRYEAELRAKAQMRYLQQHCLGSMPPLDRRRFDLLVLLVGRRFDVRVLCDESLRWVHELYGRPDIRAAKRIF